MPQPLIYHIDVNSAFLSWEAAELLRQDPDAPDIRSFPSVIGGSEKTRHGIVLAKSPSAAALGVCTGEPLAQARRKCPDLKIYAPHYSIYVERSRQFMALLKEYAPSVDAYSIDEAFCDMTGHLLALRQSGGLCPQAEGRDSHPARLYREHRHLLQPAARQDCLRL